MRSHRSNARLMASSALVGGVLSASLALFASPALAQAPAPSDSGVEEIIVTGALRNQKLQDAAMAVTAVSAESFNNSGFKSPLDLQFLSPSVQVSIQGANAIYIRGSGTNNTNGSGEQSVGLVIDGVLIGFTDDIGGDISDLDHTEVYRGPQGTQFAMNTSAGAVAIMTKKPRLGEMSTTAHFSFGEHKDTADYVTQNIPISDTMAARLTASFQHRDGVFNNVTLKEKVGEREQAALRGRLLWTPNDRASMLVSLDYRKTDEYPNFPQGQGACGPNVATFYPTIFGGNFIPGCYGALPIAAANGITINPENSTSFENEHAYRHTKTGGLSATGDFALGGGYTLTSITGYRLMNRVLHGPIGTGPIPAFYLDNSYQGSQASQEFRVSSPADKKLTFVGGLFFFKRDTVEKGLFSGSNYGQAIFQNPNTIYGQNVRISFDGGQNRIHNVNKSYAAFTDGSYHFTDKLQLNAGIRVTHDDISARIVTNPVPGVFGAFGPAKGPRALTLKDTGYTWRIGPQYFITPDVQVYGTWAHGYKGPLIDVSVAIPTKVKAEETNMLEAGIKSAWLDNRLTVNFTLFRQKYTDFQVSVLNQVVTPSVFQFGNAGGMLAKGFELEVNARPVSALRLSGGVSYNDNHYTDFLTPCYNVLEPIKQPTTGPNACVTVNGAQVVQAAGTPLVNASKWTYRLAANYDVALPNGMMADFGATYLHRSGFLSAPIDPNLAIPGYGILNLNAGISTEDAKYRLGFFARNALDKFFVAGRQASSGGFTNVLNPEAVRTVGLSLDVKFD